MKKIAALLLSVSLMISLVACGGESAPDSSNASPEVEVSEKESEPIKMEPESTESDNQDNSADEIAFEEIIAVDNEQCLIKITDIEPDNMWGYTLKAYLENKSADKTYMFSVVSASVNGVQSDPLFATEVAAGKKAKKDISFNDSSLKDKGIKELTDIEISFRVYDSNDWSADDVAKETIHVYPFGEEKASAYVRESQATDIILVDNDKTTVIVTGYEEDSVWGYTVNLFLVNKTDYNLSFSVDEASVNGFMLDPFWATSVSAQTVAFTSMSWSNSSLEENDIADVENIEMNFRVHNSDDFSADDIFNETVILKP